MTSLEELNIKIENDKKELQEIELLLEEDPSNEELQILKDELIGLIKKSNDLLASKSREVATEQSSVDISATSNINDNNDNLTTVHNQTNESILNNSSSGDPSTTAVFNGIGSTLAVGTKCEGKYSVDGIWYSAVVDTINKDGTYTVTYTDYGNVETLSVENIRPLSRQKLVNSVQDHSSRYTTASDSIQQIPKYLKILPDDSEEVKKQKQKKIHSIKAQNRLFKADEENRKKKQAWQEFQAKPKRSIPGTFTDRKKGSMFSTPDNLNGKVGVVGSGRGMTESGSFSMDKKKLQNLPGK